MIVYLQVHVPPFIALYQVSARNDIEEIENRLIHLVVEIGPAVLHPLAF